MSNSPLAKYQIKSPFCNTPRNHAIDTITIHCTAGQMSRSGMESHFMSAGVSANYGITSDGTICLIVDEGSRAWTSSSRENDNRAITIEVSSDATKPNYVSDIVMNSLIRLLVDICKRNNIPSLLWANDKKALSKPGYQNMTVHRWFTNTSCPGEYLMERMGDIADTVNSQLETNSLVKYRVQVGAFSKLENANALKDQLRALGYDCYVYEV